MPVRTEFEFTLPRGYVDGDGRVHTKGIMRPATAMDEIAPLRDPRVKANEAYLTIILLSRVIVKLGDLPAVTPRTIENLYAPDLAYLQDFYRRINENGTAKISTSCPECNHNFEVDLGQPGG